MRDVKPYLGDIIGAPPSPMRRVYRKRRYGQASRGVETGTHVVLAFVAITVLICVVALGLWLSFTLGTTPAKAHGPADWIARGGYKNSAGELCCGERDCFELTDADVKVTAAGYYVVSIKETIPFNEATPSPDGKYWRCQWGGARKCFFAPPGSV